jgi:hypothetical protein
MLDNVCKKNLYWIFMKNHLISGRYYVTDGWTWSPHKAFLFYFVKNAYKRKQQFNCAVVIVVLHWPHSVFFFYFAFTLVNYTGQRND